MAGEAYSKRYGAGGFVDLPTQTTSIDSQFLNGVEAALVRLLGADPTTDCVHVWDAGLARFKTIKLTSNNLDPAAGILKSQLAPLNITDADVAAGANISKSKLNLGASLSLIESRQILNGTTTYTAPATASKLEIEGWGAGGGGMGCPSSGVTTSLSLVAGGGGGAYCYKFLSSNIGTHTVAVALGGTAGASGGGSAAGVGGNTTFADSLTTVVLLAGGGGGGNDNEGAGTSLVFAIAGSPGAAATGDLLINGGNEHSWRYNGATGSSVGAASPLGGQRQDNTIRSANISSAGVAGHFPGGGAAGAIDTNALAKPGAAGANGLLVVKAYA